MSVTNSHGFVREWWSGTHDHEVTFICKVQCADEEGGIWKIVSAGAAVLFNDWAVRSIDADRMQVEYERAVLHELIAGKGQAVKGWARAAQLLEQQHISIENAPPSDFVLREHLLSTPAPLDEETFADAAMSPGWAALQMPRDGWHGLMSIPAHEPVMFVPNPASAETEPVQLAKAVWAIQQRRTLTAPALFEVVGAGDSPLQLVDLLAYDGIDLRERPWSERRSLLLEAVAELAGAGADMSKIAPLKTFPAGHAAVIEAPQLWLTPTNAVYGSGLRRWRQS